MRFLARSPTNRLHSSGVPGSSFRLFVDACFEKKKGKKKRECKLKHACTAAAAVCAYMCEREIHEEKNKERNATMYRNRDRRVSDAKIRLIKNTRNCFEKSICRVQIINNIKKCLRVCAGCSQSVFIGRPIIRSVNKVWLVGIGGLAHACITYIPGILHGGQRRAHVAPSS